MVALRLESFFIFSYQGNPDTWFLGQGAEDAAP